MTVAASPSIRADADVAAVQRRTLRVLLASQVLAGAGLAALTLVPGLLFSRSRTAAAEPVSAGEPA
jgi:hypothetical protein